MTYNMFGGTLNLALSIYLFTSQKLSIINFFKVMFQFIKRADCGIVCSEEF